MRLEQQLSEFRANAQRVRSDNEAKQERAKELLDEQFNKAAIEESVLKPIRTWVDTGDNLKNAKREGYKSLATQLEQRITEFVDRAQSRINVEMQANEEAVRGELTKLVGETDPLDKRGPISISNTGVVALHAEMASSYFLFALIGAILGALALGAAGYYFVNQDMIESVQLAERLNTTLPPAPQTGAIGGGIIGFVLGAIIGLLVRAGGADAVRKKKLNKSITDKVEQMLSKDIHNQLREAAGARADNFKLKVSTVLDKATAAIQSQITAINEEERNLRKMQEGAIQRITPKLEELASLSKKAREIIKWGIAKKGRA